MKSRAGAPKDAKLSPPLEVSTRRGRWRLKKKPKRKSALGIRRAQDLTDRGGEIIYARAGHYDRVSASVRFLRDPEKFTALVLAKLDVKTLSLDLELFGFDDAIHFRKRRSVWRPFPQMQVNTSRHLLRKT